MRHTGRVELDVPTRHAIQARTGLVRPSRKVTAGLNLQLAVVLDTDAGTVSVKGLPVDHARAVRQKREAMINPHVRVMAPRLLWHEQAAGWDLLAFEHIGGACHDSRPGWQDLPRVIGAMHRLGATRCPDLPVKQQAALGRRLRGPGGRP